MFIDFVSDKVQRISTGLYLVVSWEAKYELEKSGKWYLYDYEWPEFQGNVESKLHALKKRLEEEEYFSDYGSCDSPEQFMQHTFGKILQESKHQFCVLFEYMNKESYPEYRWHKNGPYIGEKIREYEHLGNEPNIQEIYQFRIYRKKI